MEKSKILAVGCGGCGCNLLNTFLDLDARYTGIFMNTNLAEMESLSHFDRDRRCFYISNADGTGKSRDLAESYIKEEAPKFAEMIKKFANQDYIIFFASGNGGTGSKAVILLSTLVKKLCPEKSINIIATFPSLNESDIDYENTIDFWNETVELKKKKIIDSIQFIDNNKSSDEQEINFRAMKELDDSFNIVGGKLDSTDSKRVHESKGYKVVLKLDNNVGNIKEAINKTIASSVFFMPDNFECDIMVGNVNFNKFNLNDIRNEIEAYEFTKFNKNEEGESIIVLGGCDMPREAIELIKEALKEVKNRKRKRSVEEDLVIRRNKPDDVIVEKNNTKANSRLSSKDLNDLFADDDFWK